MVRSVVSQYGLSLFSGFEKGSLHPLVDGRTDRKEKRGGQYLPVP